MFTTKLYQDPCCDNNITYDKDCFAVRNIHDDEALTNLTKISGTRKKSWYSVSCARQSLKRKLFKAKPFALLSYSSELNMDIQLEEKYLHTSTYS